MIWKGRSITQYGALGDALCCLTDEAEAREFWDAYVAYLSRPDAELCGKTPEAVAASNIGYLMGYYSPEERQRVYGLFPGVAHPIFGRSEPTAAEAFAAGVAGASERTDRPGGHA